MPKIRIISRPAGGAPNHIKDAWIGLEIPLVTNVVASKDECHGVSGGPAAAGGYEVDAQTAFARLAERNPTAAHWWRTNTSFDRPGVHLTFCVEACQVIDD